MQVELEKATELALTCSRFDDPDPTQSKRLREAQLHVCAPLSPRFARMSSVIAKKRALEMRRVLARHIQPQRLIDSRLRVQRCTRSAVKVSIPLPASCTPSPSFASKVIARSDPARHFSAASLCEAEKCSSPLIAALPWRVQSLPAALVERDEQSVGRNDL